MPTNRPAESLVFILAFRTHSGLLARTSTLSARPVCASAGLLARLSGVWPAAKRGLRSATVYVVVGSGLSGFFIFPFSFSPHPAGTRVAHGILQAFFVSSRPPTPCFQSHRKGRASRCCGVASWLDRGRR